MLERARAIEILGWIGARTSIRRIFREAIALALCRDAGPYERLEPATADGAAVTSGHSV